MRFANQTKPQFYAAMDFVPDVTVSKEVALCEIGRVLHLVG